MDLKSIIFQYPNGDMYFNLYAPENELDFNTLCASGASGDLHIRNSNLANFPNFKLFDINNSELLAGNVFPTGSDNYKVRISLEGNQPTQFILRIYNDSTIFKDSFTILMNTGLLFPSPGDEYYYFQQETEFVSQLVPTVPSVSQPEQFKTLFYMFLGTSVALILFPFLLLIVFK